jgi:hypothetical protein
LPSFYRRRLATLLSRKQPPKSSLLLVGSCVVVLATALVAVSSAARTAAPNRGIAVMRFGSSASIGAQHLPNYAYVILGKSDEKHLKFIKRKSPRTKVLFYESGTDLQDDCFPATRWCPVITYQEAQSHDRRSPGDPWVLKSSSGQSLINPHWPHSHLANVGSISYRRVWAKRTVSAARRGGFDGVMIDNVLGAIGGWTGGPLPTMYPSEGAWEKAMRGFIRFVGPTLTARGLYVVANSFRMGSNDGSADVAWWRSIARYVNGLKAEFWEQSPVDLRLYDVNHCCWTGHWDNWLRLADAAQKGGADFFPHQYGSSTDTRTMTYGKASFLLVWKGSGGGYIFQPRNPADPWNPAWTSSVGRPSGRRHRVGVAWRRDYTEGVALVNPDPTRAQRIPLGRSYVASDGVATTAVTLKPVSAMILHKAVATRH